MRGQVGASLHAATADNTLMPSTLHRKGEGGGRAGRAAGGGGRKNGKSQIICGIERK